MSDQNSVLAETFRNECETIADWWVAHAIDEHHGGFHGEIDEHNQPVAGAGKSIILNCRILWFFSRVARFIPKPEYHFVATRAFQYLMSRFWDVDFGGVYWMLDAEGCAVDVRKHAYAQAFAVYGLSAYYDLTDDESALITAVACFELLEKHVRDGQYGGYFEARSREWGLIEDVRLSEKEDNSPKTMNTHLHVLEAYTALNASLGMESRHKPEVETALSNLLSVFCSYIVNCDSGHTRLFLSERWADRSKAYSFGHDIEASWLITDAIRSLSPSQSAAEHYWRQVRVLGRVAMRDGIRPNGSMAEEFLWPEQAFSRGSWWVQAEAMVGLANMWAIGEGQEYLDASLKIWEHIQLNFIDRTGGEWFWYSRGDREATERAYKAGAWKGPYHNGRAMMQMFKLLRSDV